MEKQQGMKAKTIKSVLRKKVNSWLDSIDDTYLRQKCKNEAIVTGGCIASMLLGEKVSDFDIYLRNRQTVEELAEYYVKKFKEKKPYINDVHDIYVQTIEDIRGEYRVRIVVQSAGVEGDKRESQYEYFETRPPEEAGDYVSEIYDDPGVIEDLVEDTKEQLDNSNDEKNYEPVFLSSNAITLSGKIQIILRFFGDPDTIHDNYDFVHCMNYWESKTNNLVLRPKSLEALLSRTLVYYGSRYPVASIFRIRKFINRGWRINAGQILKMILQANELDLTDYAVLEDQLTGVDVAYFSEVLRVVHEEGEKIDSAYLIEVINRMFGE